MPSVPPAGRALHVVEAISALEMLQREMSCVSQGEEDYKSKQRALQAEITELRKLISDSR